LEYISLQYVEPVDQYLRNFQWNKVKYRADKPIADLIDSLQKVGNSILHTTRLRLIAGKGNPRHR
jgi:hypothetical protein